MNDQLQCELAALRQERELLNQRQEVLFFLATSPHSPSRDRARTNLIEIAQQMVTIDGEIERLTASTHTASAPAQPSSTPLEVLFAEASSEPTLPTPPETPTDS